ncbi:MAG TPA: ABC transporter permease [Acidimicrobiia bacterium]
MTPLRSTLLVVERELREAFSRRSLWIVIGLLFVGSTAAMILPGILSGGTTRYDVAIVRGPGVSTDAVEGAVRRGVRALDAAVRFTGVDTVARARRLVDGGDADVALRPSDPPLLVVRSGEDDALVTIVRQSLATVALQSRLQSAGLSTDAVGSVLRAPPPRVETVANDQSDRRAAAAILSLILYLILLLLMMQAASGVAIEKANRVSEVLLAVVRPGALFFGKVIGVTVVGLAGLAAGAIPVLVKVAVGGDLPAGLGPAIAGGFAWIVLGLVLYLTTAGALGALVERQEEAGTAVAPLSLLLVGTYVLSLSAADRSFGGVLAVFPLTSPIVMPARIALGAASTPEILASIVLLGASVVIAVRFGAAIYRRGIVSTGRRLRLGEVLRSG